MGMSPEVEWGPRDNLGNQQNAARGKHEQPKALCHRRIEDAILQSIHTKQRGGGVGGGTAASSHTFLQAPHPDFITMAGSSSNATHTLVPN